MAPPESTAVFERADYTKPLGQQDFLALKNPALLKPDVYSKYINEGYATYRERTESLPQKIAELHAAGFPQAKPEVKVGHSGPQGKVVPFTIIDDPADWKADDWKGREAEYTYYLTDSDKAEIDAAIQGLHARGLSSEADLKALKKEDFPLPTLGPKLVELAKGVSHGRGFQFVKGFPVDKYKGDQFGLIAAFWAIGLHIGRPLVNQNDYNQASRQIEGSIVNHIVNFGFKSVEGVRQPHSGNRLPFHADQGATDLIALLCLSSAESGGESKWVSAVAIHNELLRRGRKDLVEVLSKPFLLPKMVTQSLAYHNEKGEYEYEEIIPFEYHDGYLSVYFQSFQYYQIEREGKKLTPLQEEAIWAVISIAEDPRFHFNHTLQAGDLELIHNPSIFHSREPYVDNPETGKVRHLVRWWVHSDANKRPIAPTYAPRSSIQAGGGFKVPPGTNVSLPIYPIGKDSKVVANKEA